MPRLQPGDNAPSFTLLDQHRNEVRLQDYRGRGLLVYFYPEADTPGCTTQSCDARDHRVELAGLGCDVVGISPDEPGALLAFDEKCSLGFPLLADVDHAVAESWSTWGEKNVYGKIVIGMTRSAFLIDTDGVVAHAWYRVPADRMVGKAIEALAEGSA